MTTTEITMTAPRPSWAAETHTDDNVVTHSWTAPTVAVGGIFGDTTAAKLTVEVRQVDTMSMKDDRIIYRVGEPVIYLTDSDVTFSSTSEARAHAAAILEACDQLDGAQEVSR